MSNLKDTNGYSLADLLAYASKWTEEAQAELDMIHDANLPDGVAYSNTSVQNGADAWLLVDRITHQAKREGLIE